ncbi:Uncharacterized protein RNJ44_01996 [Nakaseomyces bracarensis]|uniref:Uncharacterized protein n=1 Tax=Nakaseomyces bracarensis TaxID=273131 RepID=A0ABR4NMD5_9SACH
MSSRNLQENHTGSNDNSFQGRTKKLSGWVKRIIQPGREVTAVTALHQDPTTTNNKGRAVSNNNSTPEHFNHKHTSRHDVDGRVNSNGKPTTQVSSSLKKKKDIYPSIKSTDQKSVTIKTNNNTYHRSLKKSPSKKRSGRLRSDSAPDSLPAARSISNYLAPLSPSMSCDSDRVTMSSSLRPLFANDTDSDEESISASAKPRSKLGAMSPETNLENVTSDQELDISSMAPLLSVSSSSAKSSTFSDIHSIQSTRTTVISSRTQETNSSTMAIPPASILDRGRQSTLTMTSPHPSGVTTVSSIASTNNYINNYTSQQNAFYNSALPPQPPLSTRTTQRSVPRRGSNHTLNSAVTIKST